MIDNSKLDPLNTKPASARAGINRAPAMAEKELQLLSTELHDE